MTEKKPLVTFALFAYKQEEYIEEAILGAFSQTYSPLEIVLSDDCSPDSTFEIMEKMAKEYKGPHKVILNRNQNNLGLIGHINRVFLEIANGEIVVVAAGDDISLPERVTQTWQAFKKDPKIMSVSMDYQDINKRGDFIRTKASFVKGIVSLKDFITTKKINSYGCSRAYQNKIIETFGELLQDSGVEDSNLVFRALLLGNTFHINKVGVRYRVLENSLSSNINSTQIEGILKQRRIDSEKALKLNLIDKNNFKKILNLISYFKKKHLLRNAFFTSHNNIIFYITKILPSKYLLSSEKTELLKIYLKDKIS
ncbi:glycosyltransferase family 2 protein [Lutibacter sp.]